MANAIATVLLRLMGYSTPTHVRRESIPSQRRTFGDPMSWSEFMDLAGDNPGMYATTPALKLSAVYACNDRISKDIASLPFRPVRRTDRGQEIAHDHDQYFISAQPNDHQTTYTYFYTFNSHLNLKGEAFSPITRKNGRPVAYGIWHPAEVRHQFVEGKLFWIHSRLKDRNGDPLIVSDDDMIHAMWFTDDGIRGKSVLTFARDTIQLARSASEMASSLYENQMWSPGYISYKEKLDSEQAQVVSESWTGNYAGKDNQENTPVLDQGSEYKTFAGSMRDAEIIKNRDFCVADICRFMGVPPSKMGIREGNVSYNSLEQDNIAYAQDTIMPRAISLEQEFNRKALPGDEAEDVRFKFELKNRLRGDMAARTAFYQMGLTTGLFSFNEVLSLEDMNTIGPAGDEHLVQLNLTTLSKLISGEAQKQNGKISGKELIALIQSSANGHHKSNGHAVPNN